MKVQKKGKIKLIKAIINYDKELTEEFEKKIRIIIQNVKSVNKYNLSPDELIKKNYPDHPKYSYPKRWENLYKLKGQTDKIDYLLEVSEYCKNAKERMEREEVELRQRRMQRRLEEKEAEEKNSKQTKKK